MVFAIKPGPVPSPERSFHREIDKATVGVSLKADIANNFLIGDTGLVFQKEMVFE
jgi:hypothetical protein